MPRDPQSGLFRIGITQRNGYKNNQRQIFKSFKLRFYQDNSCDSRRRYGVGASFYHLRYEGDRLAAAALNGKPLAL